MLSLCSYLVTNDRIGLKASATTFRIVYLITVSWFCHDFEFWRVAL